MTVAGGGGNGSSNQWGKGGSGGNPNGTDGGICHTPGFCTFSSGGHGATTTAAGAATGGGTAGTADNGGAGKPETGGGGGGAGCFGGGGGGDAPPTPELGGAAGGGGGGSTCIDPALTNLAYQSPVELDGSVVIKYSVAPNPAAPQITSPGTANFTIGQNGTHAITGTGNPAPAITIDNPGSLPAGLSFVPGAAGTASITGTPTGAAGIYHVLVRAANGAGTDATQDLSIIVTAGLSAPVFTNSGPGNFQVGTFGSLAVAASGTPKPTITKRTTFPAGLTLSAGAATGTATISGTPTGSSGTKTVTLRATNSEGTDDVNVSIVIAKSGAGVSGSTTTQASVSQTGSFTISNQATCTGSGPDCSVATTLSGPVGASVAATLGGSHFKVKRGKKARIKARLNRSGLKRLKKAGRIKAKLKVTVRRGKAKSTKTITVRLKAPKKRK